MTEQQWRAGWRKSTRSTRGNGCVEVNFSATTTEVRDTKHRGRGPVLSFPHPVWDTFLEQLGRGDVATAGAVQGSSHELTEHYATGPVRTIWHLTDGTSVLHFTHTERDAFLAGVAAGEFTTGTVLAGTR
ncbi:MAG: DUF397 domain-containing protein [Sciscionella sp.]